MTAEPIPTERFCVSIRQSPMSLRKQAARYEVQLVAGI